MATTVEYPHIEKPANNMARFKRHPRFRISQLAAEHLANGWSAEELCRQHPELSLAEALVGLAYYYDHREEIEDQWVAEKRDFEAWKNSNAGDPLLARLHRNGV